MAKNKIERIDQEIEKTREKIAEYQEKLKTLEAHAEAVVAKSTRTSVLDSLKRPVTPRSTDKKPKQHEEVR